MLSIKLNSDTLRNVDSNQLLQSMVEDSFKRRFEFEVTQVQKKIDADSYCWLTTTSPKQVSKIQMYKITILGELLQSVSNTNTDQLSREEVIKRNCLVLIAKGLNLTKPTDQITSSLKAYFGLKNVVSIFFPSVVGSVHSGIANIECLNAEQFLH